MWGCWREEKGGKTRKVEEKKRRKQLSKNGRCGCE